MAAKRVWLTAAMSHDVTTDDMTITAFGGPCFVKVLHLCSFGSVTASAPSANSPIAARHRLLRGQRLRLRPSPRRRRTYRLAQDDNGSQRKPKRGMCTDDSTEYESGREKVYSFQLSNANGSSRAWVAQSRT